MLRQVQSGRFHSDVQQRPGQWARQVRSVSRAESRLSIMSLLSLVAAFSGARRRVLSSSGRAMGRSPAVTIRKLPGRSGSPGPVEGVRRVIAGHPPIGEPSRHENVLGIDTGVHIDGRGYGRLALARIDAEADSCAAPLFVDRSPWGKIRGSSPILRGRVENGHQEMQHHGRVPGAWVATTLPFRRWEETCNLLSPLDIFSPVQE